MPVAAPERPKAPAAVHPTTAYARAVVAGEIVAGRLVKLAAARHIRDLESGHERGLHFDEEAANRALRFFGYLQLAEGEFAGQPFILQPWQQFIIGCLFGWKKGQYRRFRTAYVEIGKGNGKSPMAAGIGLYGLVADGEMGAEIYSAATSREQAKILFRDAQNMVNASPALAKRVDTNVGNLAVLVTRSFFRPVSSEHKGLDGKRVHMALIDELHEHPSPIVVDKMRAGTKARRQALIFEITNSGHDRHSVCWQHHEYSRQILEQSLENDSWFAYVCGLDPCAACLAAGKSQPTEGCEDCDDWRNEAVWPKANPNLGVSIRPDYLREQVLEAVGMPSKQNIVKRLNMCLWTEQVTKWLPLDKWDECGLVPVDPEGLAGQRCFGGLDLAATTDLAAFALVFPDDDGSYDALVRFWCPEATVAARSRAGVPYDQWVEAGWITATEGDVIDYDVILADILADSERFRIEEIGYDRWNASQLVTYLVRDGAAMVPIGQGYASLSAPAKELEKLIVSGKLRHGGNPVLRWMASNVSKSEDPSGNIKPDREHSSEKIDGIVAMVDALARAVVNVGESGDGGMWVFDDADFAESEPEEDEADATDED